MDIKRMLEIIDSEQFLSEYGKSEKKRRILFFMALGIEDDGRRCPVMSEEEFRSFGKTCKDSHEGNLKGKTCVEIFYKFESYFNVAYDYCFEDDTVYERRSYVGD